MKKLLSILMSSSFLFSFGVTNIQKSTSNESLNNNLSLSKDIAHESFMKDATTAKAAGFNSISWETTTMIDASYKVDPESSYIMQIKSGGASCQAEGTGFNYQWANPWGGDKTIKINYGQNMKVNLAYWIFLDNHGKPQVGESDLNLYITFNQYGYIEVRMEAANVAINQIEPFGWTKVYSTYDITYNIY